MATVTSLATKETHLSWLFLLGDRVFKVKKPVRTDFVDLTTPARRRAICEREVALNRRLAPDVYRGVGTLLGPDGMAEPVVVMRRMPEDRRLAALLDDPDAPRYVDEVADVLAGFHRTASRTRATDAAGSPVAVTELWDDGMRQLRAVSVGILDDALLGELDARALAYLRGRSALLRARVAAGRCVDGHGDLLADDVFLLDDGPRILDCLEFDDDLRYGDVLADVAFLAMDLERLGHPELARRFLHRSRALREDDWPESLAHWWIAYRAGVRAKVACLRAAQGDPFAAGEAVALAELALQHLRSAAVRVVLVGGSPGTGKSTVAAAVGEALGWPVVRSDVVRRRDGTPSYVPQARAATYGAVLAEARELLSHGRSVLLDATWGSEQQRRAAAALALETSSELVSWRVVAAPDVVDARITARLRAGTDPSDADPAVARRLAADFAPWPEATVVDTTAGVPDVLPALVERLRTATAPPPAPPATVPLALLGSGAAVVTQRGARRGPVRVS